MVVAVEAAPSLGASSFPAGAGRAEDREDEETSLPEVNDDGSPRCCCCCCGPSSASFLVVVVVVVVVAVDVEVAAVAGVASELD